MVIVNGQWLHFYNHESPHRGYRNTGRRPVETIEVGMLISEEMQKKRKKTFNPKETGCPLKMDSCKYI